MRGRLGVVFAALCVWSSLEWLAGDLLPVGMGSVAGRGLGLLLIGCGGMAIQLVSERGVGWWGLWRLGGTGLLLVGGPLLLLDAARGAASATLGVVVFAMVPVGVMVGVGALRLLPWSLAGVAGVLMLLPVALPETARGWTGVGLLVGAAGLTAVGLVKMPQRMQDVGLAGAVGALGLGSGTLLVLAGWLEGTAAWRWDAVGAELVRAVVVDGPELLLLLWLVRDMAPLRVSARYLVAPLLTVAEGWWVVRTGVGVRMAMGMVLLAGGAMGMLWGDVRGEEGSLRLG